MGGKQYGLSAFSAISEPCKNKVTAKSVIPIIHLINFIFITSFRLGEACNHIAALMYAIADISQRKKDGTLAPTSEKCKWNNPRKRKLSPQKAQDKISKTVWGRETVNRDSTQAMTTEMNIKTAVNIF